MSSEQPIGDPWPDGPLDPNYCFPNNSGALWYSGPLPKQVSMICDYQDWCRKPSFGGTYCIEHLLKVCSDSVTEQYGDIGWAAKQLEIIRCYLREHPEEALEL